MKKSSSKRPTASAASRRTSSAAPVEPVDLARLVVVEAAGVERVQPPRARRELADEEVLGREPPERRLAAHRALQRPVGVAQPRPDDGRLGMRVGERDEPLEPVADDPGVRVEQEEVAAVGRAHAGVVAAAHAAVLLLDHAHVREALAHELERAVGRAVVDDDRLVAAHRLEALLEPRQRVPRHDDDRRRQARRRIGHRRAGRRRSPRGSIASPGSASTSVITKKRKPQANACVGVDAELAEEADEERLAHAEAVDRERHEHDEEEQRPEHDVRPHREVDPDRAARRLDRDDRASAAAATRDGADDEQRPGMVAVAVDALVDRARGRSIAQPAERAARANASRRRTRAREEDERRRASVSDDEERLDPEVRRRSA